GFFTGQQQAVAEFSPSGRLVDPNVFGTTGTSAVPGVLTTVGSSASLPGISSASEILELQPDGEIFAFNPVTGQGGAFDKLADDTGSGRRFFAGQSGSYPNLASTIDLAGATFGDFGVSGNSVVISAESNNWDFVMRVTYGAQGSAATVLAASPASDGRA